MVAIESLTPSELQLISELRLFSCLSRPELQALAAKLTRRSYKRGEIIYHHDDLAGSLFILTKGRVKIRLISPNGTKEVTYGWATPGVLFGATNLIGEGSQQSDTVAVEPCEVLVLARDDFRDFLAKHPEANAVLLEMMAVRFRRAIARFYDLAFLDAPARLAKVLVQQAEQQGEEQQDGSIVLSNITQRELASLIGTTRESTNKWLHFFVRQRCIEFNRGAIRILRLDELRKRAS
jgi:CRP-like cAMP-binding protein